MKSGSSSSSNGGCYLGQPSQVFLTSHMLVQSASTEEIFFTTVHMIINFKLSLLQILEQLDHVSIVRLEEVFYAEGKVLMVLEYLPGGDLFDGLVSRPFYSEKDACACAHQIITALNYLARKGIIHRVRNYARGDPRIKV